MDLDSVREIFEMNKFDACVHLAGKTSVLDSLNSPNETTQCNIKGTLNLLEASYQTDLSTFVFASSAAVYGNTTRLPLSEGSPPSPISHYGATKVVGEELVRCYSLKINACISLRLFNVYGTGQNASYAGVITKFRERLYDGLPPVIYGDGTQRRDFISVKDAVRAIVLAAELKTRNSKSPFIFNIGTGTSKSIGELATLMINMSRQYSLRPVYLGGVQEDICNRREAGGLP